MLFVHAGLLPSVARAFVERAAPGPAEAALEEQLLLLSMGRARPRRRRAAMGTFRLDAFVKAPKPRIRRRSVAEGQAAIEALNEEVLGARESQGARATGLGGLQISGQLRGTCSRSGGRPEPARRPAPPLVGALQASGQVVEA